MSSLINRLVRVISFCCGFVVYNFLFGGVHEWISRKMGIIISVGLGFAIKGIFFPKNFLKTSLTKETKQQAIIDRDEKIEQQLIGKEKAEQEIPTSNTSESMGGQIEKSAFITAIKSFFKTNLLAKIGAILIFLGVVFLLSLVWNKIPSFGKIGIGFLIGFAVYFVGIFLHKKALKGEAMILLGTGILINFLVILGGRYLLSSIDVTSPNSFTPFLSSSITLVLLFLNTIFGIGTALKYKSRTLLLFGFFFAYINPFLIGESSHSPYFLLGYALLVSLGGFVVGIKQKDSLLPLISFIGGSLLCCLAPFENQTGRIAKFLSVAFLALGTLFLFTHKQVNIKQGYITVVIMYFFLFLVTGARFFLHEEIGNSALLILAIVLFLIGGYLYYLTKKTELSRLYSIGTLGSVLILSLLIDFNLVSTIEQYKTLAIFILTFFTFAYALFPVFQSDLLKKNTINLILGQVIATLFVALEMYQYGQAYLTTSYVGWCFMAFTLLFGCLAFWIFQRYQETTMTTTKEEHDHLQNSLYLYIATAIASFSFGISLLFQNTTSIVSVIWLCEATILFFLFSRIHHSELYTFGIILSFVGIIKSYNILQYAETGGWSMFIPLVIITVSLLLNLKFLNQPSLQLEKYSPLYDLMHVAGIGIMTVLLRKILPEGNGRNFFVLATFLACLGSIYKYFKSNIIKVCFLVGLFCFLGVHIIRSESMQQLPQYLSTAVLFVMTIFWHRAHSKNLIFRNILNTGIAIYLLIIGSMYVYDITPNTFAITIFRGIISVVLLVLGISYDKLTQRTLGLYVLLLVLLKIGCFDLWYGLNDALSRVIVFIILGSLLIFVSTRYTKRYGNNLTEEFAIENLYY